MGSWDRIFRSLASSSDLLFASSEFWRSLCFIRVSLASIAMIATSRTAECPAMALVSGMSVHKTPLRRRRPVSAAADPLSSSPPSPWCYSADAFTLFDFDDEGASGDTTPSLDTKMSPNFLATQVWPSARAAAAALESRSDPNWSICEFGCGPALPSVAAAATRRNGAKIIATDYDEFALKLVEAAAREQGFSSILSTQVFDLTSEEDTLPEADCYVMSDVFECAAVAYGAAKQTLRALDIGKRVWVFAQSDRAQREIYRQHLNDMLQSDKEAQVVWSNKIDIRKQLVLFDVDEMKVEYC